MPAGGILRRGKGRGGGTRQVRFELGPAGKEEEEEEDGGGCPPPPLATPTPHSSLGGAALAAGGGPRDFFDAPRAAAELLGSSFAARCALGGAARAMNVPPAQRLYSGLVSLAPPPLSAPRKGGAPPTPPPPKVPGPELGVLVGEVGGEGGPWLPPPTPPTPPRPLATPPGAAFLMYRKLQQWGGG